MQNLIDAKYVRALRRMYLLFRRKGDALTAGDCVERELRLAPDSKADGCGLNLQHPEAGNRCEGVAGMPVCGAGHTRTARCRQEETMTLDRQTGMAGMSGR